MIGRELSHFRITAKLGEGGMGEVYRAEDVALGREVAIKVLPRAVAANPERLARFEREARVLASLNHPNVGAVYEVGQGTASGSSSDDETAEPGAPAEGSSKPDAQTFDGQTPDDTEPVHFLVMELVEGEDLEARLRRGPVPLAEARSIARQVAKALEAAHAKGIVHRDLKPANVMLKPGGEVKVLDFGLAKAMERGDADRALSLSPTLTAHTAAGVLLGTAAYMSPEQARGLEVDQRTDIWAFGCVLYEMLSGRPAFGGDTVSDVLARILERQVDLQTLPHSTPAAIRRLLARCLEKDATRRLRDIADAHWDLSADADQPEVAAPTELGHRDSRGWIVAAFVAGLVAGAGLLWSTLSRSEPQAPSRAYRLDLQIPPSDTYHTLQNSALALSPDGGVLAYAARPADSPAVSQLYLRRLDRFEATPVPDSFGAYAPFFSPDGEWIGYFDDTGLWKRPVRGGSATELVGITAVGRGASWTRDDRIFYAPAWYSPIFVVSASGGAPEQVTKLLEDEKSHRFPSALPDGSALIFTVSRADTETFDDGTVAMVSLQSGERKTLVDGASFGRFVAPDRLVFGRAGSLFVARLDMRRMEVEGPPVPVIDDLLTSPTFGSAQLAISAGGDLAYLAGGPSQFDARVVEVSPGGDVVDLPLPPRPFTMIDPSPDGRRLAMRIDGANGQIWVYDLERGTLSKITQTWDADFPVWHPSGEWVSYVLSKGQTSELARVRADGTGEPEILVRGENITTADWDSDGTTVIYADQSPETSGDLWILHLGQESSTPTPYLQTSAWEANPRISPDGRWLAYTSDQSGRPEIYVQAYPVPGRRYQVSVQGGDSASWSPERGELVFRNGEDILAVAVQLGEGFEAGLPRKLFSLPSLERGTDSRGFTVSRDGRYYAVLPPRDHVPSGRLHLVLGWTGTLD